MGVHGFVKKDLQKSSLASVESLSMPLVHKIVVWADIGCSHCQKRVADIMARMKDTESVLVNVLEKKITLTSSYPKKITIIKRLIKSCTHRK